MGNSTSITLENPWTLRCFDPANESFIVENNQLILIKDGNQSQTYDIVLYPSANSENSSSSSSYLSPSLTYRVKINAVESLINCTNTSQSCPSDSSLNAKNCTVVIAFLASLCLILLTALSLALIVIRRQKALRKQVVFHSDQNPKDSAENFITPRKSETPIVSNGVTLTVPVMDGVNRPRKSSLKTPKITPPDVVGDKSNGGYCNNGYKEDDERASQSSNKSNEDTTDGVFEVRRKSVVTFNENAEIIQIASRLNRK